MTKPFPLQTLLDLSQLRMDAAARRLGELLAGEQRAGERVSLLQQYRDEYHQRFLAAAKAGLGRDAWSNYQSFLGRLDEAILQAQALVEQSKQRTAAGQREWIDKRGRVQAFDSLSERHRRLISTAENRQDQKLQDEHAARFHQAPEVEE